MIIYPPKEKPLPGSKSARVRVVWRPLASVPPFVDVVAVNVAGSSIGKRNCGAGKTN
jgi:hypothetical protein